MLAIVGLIAGFGLSLYILKTGQMADRSKRVFRSASEAFWAELDRDADMMSNTLDVLAADDALRKPFLARDAKSLLKWAQPLFQRLRQRHRITHLYFLDPGRKCILRVHKPERDGDKIHRFTAIEAEKTGKIAHGIELGPLGTFTLRVVRPWYQDGLLIGYIELGEEIEHIITHLGRLWGVEFCIAIHKKFLDRKDWQEGMKMLDRQADWDQFPASVVVTRTLETIPEEVSRRLAKGRHDDAMKDAIEVSLGDLDYSAAFQELKDAGGREVGDMVILRDVTLEHTAFRGTMIAATLICLVVGAGLCAFFYVFLGRIGRKLTRQTDNLTRANVELHTEINRRQEVEEEVWNMAKFPSENPNPVLRLAEDGTVLYANAAGESLLGEWDCKVGGQVSRQWRQRVADVLASGASDHTDVDYQEGVLSIEIIPVVEAGYANLYGRDVTELRRAETSLRDSEERFRTLAVASPAGIYMTDLQGNFLYVNQRWCEMAGLEPEDAFGQGWVKGLDPEDRERIAGLWYETVRSGGQWAHEYRFRTPEGKTTWVYDEARVLHDTQGQIVGYMGTNTDITDRKRAEKALQETRDGLAKQLEERTAELASANEALQGEVARRKRAEEEAERLSRDA